jgi:beta-glucosidase
MADWEQVGNEQETQRNPSTGNGTTIEAVSANIDDKTMHELYLWPFANAVHAGVASVMCSYNRVNGSYGCQNSKTLNGLLKDELGFQGYVMSDWGGTHSGVASMEAGLDMNMPGGINFLAATPSYFGENITIAVQNGTFAESRVDDMILRIMTPYYYLKQDQGFPSIDPSIVSLNFFAPSTWVVDFDLNGTSNRDVRANHGQHIRDLGSAGTVLLKNTNNALPLKAPKNIGVFGNDAGDLTQGQYSLSLSSFGSNPYGYEFGTLDIGGGSGTGRHSYIVPPLDAIKARAAQDGALVQYILDNTYLSSPSNMQYITPVPEVCIVFTKTWASEGEDRVDLTLNWNASVVVENVAAVCNNTIVVTHSSGPNDLPFADNPNVTAILAAHYPGEETGNSIVDILWGDVNPSGKLPYTVALNASDYNTDITNSTELAETTDPNAWQSDFVEGVFIDYRYFDQENKTARYEFGYGLSYTTFALSDLQSSSNGPLSLRPDAANAKRPGGNPQLWETVATVTATVANTGAVAGAAVPQLYVSLPAAGEPVKVLRGFDKVMLQPGESTQVSFPLMRRDLSSWDTTAQDWILTRGSVGLMVGFSSRDIVLTGTLAM